MLDRLRRMEPFGSAVWADFRHSRRTLPSDFTPACRNRDDGGKQVEIYRLGHVVVGPELRTLWAISGGRVGTATQCDDCRLAVSAERKKCLLRPITRR
jgi:hypothetical protein